MRRRVEDAPLLGPGWAFDWRGRRLCLRGLFLRTAGFSLFFELRVPKPTSTPLRISLGGFFCACVLEVSSETQGMREVTCHTEI